MPLKSDRAGMRKGNMKPKDNVCSFSWLQIIGKTISGMKDRIIPVWNVKYRVEERTCQKQYNASESRRN